MSTEQEQIIVENEQQAKKEKPGVSKLLQDAKRHKKLYFKVLPIVFILAVVYTLGQPNFYQCTVKLAPEMSGQSKSGGSLSSLASSFGINLGGNNSGTDAIYPFLYPELMNSVTFRTSLFPIMVHREGEDQMMSYYDYLLNEQKTPWWSGVTKAIFSIFGGDKDADLEEKEVNNFKLTKEQTLVAKTIGQKVVCDVDKKTMVITINVTDQDPLIAATIADSVQNKLQEFITDYRTSKARIDVEHYQKLCDQAKEDYEKALSAYASFSDHNQKIFLERVRSQQSRLENELSLQQNAYTQIAAQLKAAEAKLQEETPAFTTLQPATVPILKAGPKRASTCLIWLFLGFIATTLWILHKEGDLKPLLFGSEDDEE